MLRPTIGFVCPLFAEFKAVKATFDVELEKKQVYIYGVLHYIYQYGRIGNRDVVATYFRDQDIGLVAAGRYAQKMLKDHPSLEETNSHCFLVGVAAGIWTKKDDVRLGDVVLATHVLDWSFGKHLSEEEFTMTKHPLEASNELLYMVAEFMYDSKNLAQKVISTIDNMMRKDSDPGWTYPGTEKDLLFKGTYLHLDEASDCGACDATHLQPRNVRHNTLPKVHRGLIASGNSVLRDAKWRGQLASRGVLAVEMEASAVVTIEKKFIVIRGICDYADSHKNKTWQKYAAATAAATARLLIDEMDGSKHLNSAEHDDHTENEASSNLVTSTNRSHSGTSNSTPTPSNMFLLQRSDSYGDTISLDIDTNEALYDEIAQLLDTNTTEHIQSINTEGWKPIFTGFVTFMTDNMGSNNLSQHYDVTLIMESYEFSEGHLPIRRLKISSSTPDDPPAIISIPHSGSATSRTSDVVKVSFDHFENRLFRPNATKDELSHRWLCVVFDSMQNAADFEDLILHKDSWSKLRDHSWIRHSCGKCMCVEGLFQGLNEQTCRVLYVWHANYAPRLFSYPRSHVGPYKIFKIVMMSGRADFRLEFRGESLDIIFNEVELVSGSPPAPSPSFDVRLQKEMQLGIEPTSSYDRIDQQGVVHHRAELYPALTLDGMYERDILSNLIDGSRQWYFECGFDCTISLKTTNSWTTPNQQHRYDQLTVWRCQYSLCLLMKTRLHHAPWIVTKLQQYQTLMPQMRISGNTSMRVTFNDCQTGNTLLSEGLLVEWRKHSRRHDQRDVKSLKLLFRTSHDMEVVKRIVDDGYIAEYQDYALIPSSAIY